VGIFEIRTMTFHVIKHLLNPHMATVESDGTGGEVGLAAGYEDSSSPGRQYRARLVGKALARVGTALSSARIHGSGLNFVGKKLGGMSPRIPARSSFWQGAPQKVIDSQPTHGLQCGRSRERSQFIET
jgi:hypothetical protein